MRCTISTLILATVVTAFCGFDSGGCDDGESTSDKTQRLQQEQMSQNANQQVGMPGISNFTEKKIMKRLYEMRDQNIATYTYLVDMQGRLHHVCDSMGYGLPYATQFSSPEKIQVSSDGQHNLQQRAAHAAVRAKRPVYAGERGGDVGDLRLNKG